MMQFVTVAHVGTTADFVTSHRFPARRNGTERVVVWLTHLLRIREVRGQNIGLKTGYPKLIVVFLSLSNRMLG
jgi:hypothetical protein